ncbi:MAG: MoaD/ThiS family protein [Anaerolineales bacterium]|nr:MoaD/ThiS family protein [Chloroflexota bacterium]MBL6982652.1 MoaD/ThiS family protein [Anaerolineales bacterium]
MKIYLGAHLNFYHPEKKSWLNVEIQQPVALAEILESAGIPLGEIHMVVVNNEIEEMSEVMISPQDEVKIFPPVGGG